MIQGVTRVAFRPDGAAFLTACGGEIYFWDATDRNSLGSAGAHRANVTAMAFSPDGSLLATAGADSGVRLWDPRSLAALGPPLSHWGTVNSVAFAPDGKSRVTACYDGYARVWGLASTRPAREVLEPNDRRCNANGFPVSGPSTQP